MISSNKLQRYDRAIDLFRLTKPAGLALALALGAAAPVAAQTALDSATVTIPAENRKPSTDLSVIKEQTATGFVIRVTNTGPDSVSGVIVSDAVGRGSSCRPNNPVKIAATGASESGSSIANLTGQGIVLGTLNSGQTVTLSFSCQGN